MAAGSRGDVRVRLMFEYPPPAIPESCMFWILLDTQRCRVVTDLTSIIRQRFFYSQRGALSLYVDDCLLPPGENIRVIRDNDSIRVKFDECYPEEDTSNSPSRAHPPKKLKKRHRQKSEDDGEEYTVSKHKKQKCLQSLILDSDSVEKARKEKKKKKKTVLPDKEADQSEQLSESPRKSSAKKKTEKHNEQSPVTKAKKFLPPPKPNCEPKNKGLRQSSSSDSSMSSSDNQHESATVQKKPPKRPGTSSANVSVTKASVNSSGKVKRRERSSSSSDSDSREKDNTQSSIKEAAVIAPSLDVASEKPEKKKVSSSSDSSDSDSFVIKKAVVVPPVSGSVSPCLPNGHVADQQGALGRGIGRGRGTDGFPWRGQRGRGFRGRGDSRNQGRGRGESKPFFYNYDTKQQQLNEPATNTSILIQNPPAATKKDYSTLPLLAAPPQTGKIIAFKLLELAENYTPEVSDYKEGRILSYDPVSQQLEVEILSSLKKKEPGKFDLVYECADGTDIVEYAVPQECKITQAWNSLIEPRLVMENGSEERTLPQPETVAYL
ncbi:coilin [Pseudophryne corroboree]|uniref:coilin n=1 Tax=Pseudophryne corroboree TaxID=495146 RepID=UPI0030814F55